MQIALDNAAAAGTAGTTPPTANDAASSDRFLKLLVAQMQNQDPLNPMDNAQITTQMAQISTVDGISKLNTTVQGLSGQLMSMQAMQGASLVGHDVTVVGDRIAMVDGIGHGGFEIGSAADRVQVEVLNASGTVVDTIELGAQGAGRHAFEWTGASEGDIAEYRFRVNAFSGATQLPVGTRRRERVEAVSCGGNTITLELARAGNVPYGDIVAFN